MGVGLGEIVCLFLVCIASDHESWVRGALVWRTVTHMMAGDRLGYCFVGCLYSMLLVYSNRPSLTFETWVLLQDQVHTTQPLTRKAQPQVMDTDSESPMKPTPAPLVITELLEMIIVHLGSLPTLATAMRVSHHWKVRQRSRGC